MKPSGVANLVTLYFSTHFCYSVFILLQFMDLEKMANDPEAGAGAAPDVPAKPILPEQAIPDPAIGAADPEPPAEPDPAANPEPAAGQSGEDAAQPPPDPADKSCEKVELGKPDRRGQNVIRIYANSNPEFTVYLAELVDKTTDAQGGQNSVSSENKPCVRHIREVRVEYSKHEATRQKQLTKLAKVRALRGEIDGLMDKLMISLLPEDCEDQREADAYNRRVADAMVVGLQSDDNSADAANLLTKIKEDIEDRRAGLARLHYCKSVFWMTLISVSGIFALVLVAAGIHHGLSAATGASVFNDPILRFMSENRLWLSAIFACLGAWTSIAISIRAKKLIPSSSELASWIDGGLRIIVAIASATVLISIINLNLVSISFGGNPIDFNCGILDLVCRHSWHLAHVTILLSFIAGFAEQFVSGILDTVAQSPKVQSDSGGTNSSGAGGAGVGAP